MEGFALISGVPSIRLDRDCHPADRILRRLCPRRNVGRRVMMIVLHGLPAFRSLVSACGFQRLEAQALF